MDENELKNRVKSYIKEISHYSQMQVFATSYYQKNYFQILIDEAEKALLDLYKNRTRYSQEGASEMMPQSMPERTFTLQELAEYNGSRGKAAYVAVNGRVYDVSNLIGWAGGTHFGLYAGKDLSKEFMKCHRGMMGLLKNAVQVGTLL